jgi:hypothetical protein
MLAAQADAVAAFAVVASFPSSALCNPVTEEIAMVLVAEVVDSTVVVILTFPDPSTPVTVPVTSPANVIDLPVVQAAAVVAVDAFPVTAPVRLPVTLPVKFPTNVVALITDPDVLLTIVLAVLASVAAAHNVAAVFKAV